MNIMFDNGEIFCYNTTVGGVAQLVTRPTERVSRSGGERLVGILCIQYMY